MNAEALAQIVSVSHSSAAGHHGVLSTGEALAAALVRNRPDLLGDYTIVDALDRIGEHWAALLPAAARQFNMECDRRKERAADAARDQQHAALAADAPADGGVVDANVKLITYGSAPGYRDCSLVVDVTPLGKSQAHRLGLHFKAGDALDILDHLRDINRLAWRDGQRGPLDRREGETRPQWLTP